MPEITPKFTPTPPWSIAPLELHQRAARSCVALHRQYLAVTLTLVLDLQGGGNAGRGSKVVGRLAEERWQWRKWKLDWQPYFLLQRARVFKL